MKSTIELVEQVQDTFRRVYEPRGMPADAGCLLWSCAVLHTLHQNGVNGVLQAGSSNWPLLPRHLDDGVSSTHFGYVFEADVAKVRFAQGWLPEVHVWVVVPETETLIDMTTAYQPAQCRKMIGKEFHPESVPPPYFWDKFDRLPDWWRYKADAVAIAMMHAFIVEYHEMEVTEL